MCHQACPEAIGTKFTPGTLTCVLQLADGNETCIYCCCASEAKIKSIEMFASKLGKIVSGTVPDEVYNQKEEENMP